jgi:hypothetical protein
MTRIQRHAHRVARSVKMSRQIAECLRSVAESVQQQNAFRRFSVERDRFRARDQGWLNRDCAFSNCFVALSNLEARSAISDAASALSFFRIASFTDGNTIVE